MSRFEACHPPRANWSDVWVGCTQFERGQPNKLVLMPVKGPSVKVVTDSGFTIMVNEGVAFYGPNLNFCYVRDLVSNNHGYRAGHPIHRARDVIIAIHAAYINNPSE